MYKITKSLAFRRILIRVQKRPPLFSIIVCVRKPPPLNRNAGEAIPRETPLVNQSGAVVACWAHNPKVEGSIPSSDI